MSRSIFSGEPLPLVPNVESKEELERFHFKVIEYLRRLGAKLDNQFNDPPGPGGAGIPSVSRVMAHFGGVQPGVYWQEFPAPHGGTTWGSPPDAEVPWDADLLSMPHLDTAVYEIQGRRTKIKVDGLYLIMFELGFGRHFTLVPAAFNLPALDARLVIREDTGEAFVPLGGWVSVRENETMSFSALYPLRRNVTLAVECIVYDETKPAKNPNITFEFIESNFQVMKMQGKIDGGGGGGWPNPGIPPWAWISFGIY